MLLDYANPMYDRIMKTALERFTAKYEVNPNTSCWEWVAAKIPGGYGSFSYSKAGEVHAHRAAYIMFVGPIPQKLWILHKCDNRKCVNPDHLFLGTPRDNERDKIAKGRKPIFNGEETSNNKLTTSQVLAIRSDFRTQDKIALAYGIAQSQVSRIKSGKRWGHLPL
jgi:hypothetical protein